MVRVISFKKLIKNTAMCAVRYERKYAASASLCICRDTPMVAKSPTREGAF